MQQWICAAVVFVVNPLKTAFTVMMFVTVSQVIRAVPVPCDSGCAGFSLSGLSPGATGPVATNVRVAAGLLTATMTKRANTHPICFIEVLLLRRSLSH